MTVPPAQPRTLRRTAAMDSRFHQDHARRAIVVNRGSASSAPVVAGPSSPLASMMPAAMMHRVGPSLRCVGPRPPVRPAVPAPGPRTSPPPLRSATMMPPPLQGALTSSPVPFPLGPFCPARRAASPSLQPEEQETAWSWQGPDQPPPQLPSFGARTAAASSSSEMAGSLGSSLAALSSSPPSPPHSSADQQLTDSSDVDDFTALALSRLTDSFGRLMPSSGSQLPPQVPSSKPPNGRKRSGCAFCRGNGELPRIYNSHSLHLKMPDGTLVVSCEVLRSLRCELCGATGDVAHTRSHCPFNREPSVAVLLKSTPRRCDGSLRKRGRK